LCVVSYQFHHFARGPLDNYKKGDLNLSEALQSLSNKGIDEMGFATIDTDRLRRTGMPEVIYSAGKSTEQVAQIAERMLKNGIDILATSSLEEFVEAFGKAVFTSIGKDESIIRKLLKSLSSLNSNSKFISAFPLSENIPKRSSGPDSILDDNN